MVKKFSEMKKEDEELYFPKTLNCSYVDQDLELLSKVGYLYRTTAVYGSGKFGLADRFRIKNREEIYGPFRLEMMLVYLVRQFTFDQVNHIAKHKNPNTAVELDLNICRNLGIGNSTGLGMAPFIVNHPILLNNWILARETALKKIREIKDVKQEDFNYFFECLKNSINNINTWNTDSDFQNKKIKQLNEELEKFIDKIKVKIDNLGAINLAAIDELQEQQERKQKQRLTKTETIKIDL